MAKTARAIPVQLDKTRHLLYDLNAFAEFEGAMGCSITHMLAGGDLETRMGIREARALIWAGLLHEEPTLTLRRAGELLEEAPGATMAERIQYFTQRMTEALRGLRGGDEEDGEKKSPQT